MIIFLPLNNYITDELLILSSKIKEVSFEGLYQGIFLVIIADHNVLKSWWLEKKTIMK